MTLWEEFCGIDWRSDDMEFIGGNPYREPSLVVYPHRCGVARSYPTLEPYAYLSVFGERSAESWALELGHGAIAHYHRGPYGPEEWCVLVPRPRDQILRHSNESASPA